jgi:hypothetical protein
VRPIARAGLLVAACLAASPASVRAWADASVRGVTAHVRIATDGRVEVTLVAAVHVQGGWLEGFEIDGLDPTLELDPERPPTFEDALGLALEPRVEHRGEGRINFVFRRRDAPRRGDYVATVRYRARAMTEAAGDGRVRVHWTLPGWRFGLDDVTITLDLPRGAEIVPGDGDESSISVERLALDAHSERIVLRRVHLPRTREWPVVLELPVDALDASALAPPPAPAPVPDVAPVPAPDPWPGVTAVLGLALLAIAKNVAAARAERRSRVPRAALVPLGFAPRGAAILGLAIGAVLADPFAPLGLGLAAAIAVLAIHRRSAPPRAPRLGSFRAATRDEIAGGRRNARAIAWGPESIVDPTTVPGAALMIALLAAPAALSAVPTPIALFFSSLAAVVMIGGSRHARPSAPGVDLARMISLAARVRIDLERPFAIRPVLHADVRGEVQESRLRIVLPATPKGLLRLDVVCAARAERARWSAELVLLVVAREGSPADRALEERYPGTAIVRAPRRVARQLAIGRDPGVTIAAIVEALARCPIESPPGIVEADVLAATA